MEKVKQKGDLPEWEGNSSGKPGQELSQSAKIKRFCYVAFARESGYYPGG